MTDTRRIAVLVGSLRKESLNRKTAQALAHMAPESLTLETVEIGHLPFYDEDLDRDPPREWTEFRETIRSRDGVLFVSPEYNRSVPGVLKNAIDVGSRPYGQSAFEGKPAAVATVSPGGIGGFGANHHLRQSLVFLDMPVLQQPEAYFANAGDFFNEDGEVKSEATRKVFQRFIDAYAGWVETVLGQLPEEELVQGEGFLLSRSG